MAELDTTHTVIESLLGIGGFVLALFTKRTLGQLDSVQSELTTHRVEDAGKYATNADVRESLNRIHNRLDDLSQDINTLVRKDTR